jgi:CelD/BcsL family acetyltransferase involved in cellulose biosynthesis
MDQKRYSRTADFTHLTATASTFHCGAWPKDTPIERECQEGTSYNIVSCLAQEMIDTPTVTLTARQIRPLEDPRWDGFLQRHPHSSVFHTTAWLQALRRTYGYEPVAFTTSLPDLELDNAVVFCVVDSWITGRRLVSLPFSDHCDPLVGCDADQSAIFATIDRELNQKAFRYVELRPVHLLEYSTSLFRTECRYYHHQIDLRPDIDTLFHNCHKDSIQRKIRRAERERLTYEEGRSESHLLAFYRLWLLTRRRHHLPPQPKRWFQSLIDCFGEALKIRIASKDGQAIAAILTICHRDTLFYKYGCSDAQYHNLGAMPLLLWRSIQEAKEAGLRIVDLGRSDWEGVGLVTFKDRWGTARSELAYSRLVPSLSSKGAFGVATNWGEVIAKRALPHLPDRLFCSVGELLYKHVG